MSLASVKKPRASKTRRAPRELWIARDASGEVWLFVGKPILRKHTSDGKPLEHPIFVPANGSSRGVAGRCVAPLCAKAGDRDDDYPSLPPKGCRQLMML